MTWTHPDLPYRVILHNADWTSAQTWCDENVGAFDQDWYKLGIDPMEALKSTEPVQTIWFFRREADAVAFTLKWS